MLLRALIHRSAARGGLRIGLRTRVREEDCYLGVPRNGAFQGFRPSENTRSLQGPILDNAEQRPCGPPAHHARGRPGRRGRATRACTPAAPRGSARDSTPAGSAADTAPSTPTAALAPTAAPHPPDGRPAPSSAGPRSWDTRRALYTKTAPGARARHPRTESASR